MEKWKSIKSYEGMYEASDLGRIRSVNRIDCIGRRRIGKILSPSICNGYLGVNLSNNSNVKYKRIHELVAETFLNDHFELSINHINGIKYDNRVENLEYCTHVENIHHSLVNNLKDNKLWSLGNLEVLKILKECYESTNIRCVSEKYGIRPQVLISLINRSSAISKKIPIQNFENISFKELVKIKKEERKNKIITLRSEGLGLNEISEMFNITENRVYQICKYGVKIKE